MIRVLLTMIACVLLLSGCGDSPRVERKPLVEAVQEPQPAMPADTFHGMASREAPQADLSSHEVRLDKLVLQAPESWTRKAPAVDFILAEFALPRAEGDPADGRLTVSSAGGTVDANIDRWRQQFGDKPEKQSREKLEVSGMPVTLVDFSGTFRDQRGPFAPAIESPNYRMLAAIVDAQGQLFFIKCYGPAKTMASRAEQFRQFVRSLKAASGS